MKIFKEVIFVGSIGIIVAILAIISLQNKLIIGPILLGLGLLPLLGTIISGRNIVSLVPDLVFGSIDTGLLAIPAIAGATYFGVAGAIAGGVVGDAITDAIAGFFEGGIARWLRAKGIIESRDPISTSLGKMAGCLIGAGLILSIASFIGCSVLEY